MAARSMAVVLAVVAVTAGLAAWRAVPASSGPDRLGTREITDIVDLLHHDQQGIVLAHQAEAQSSLTSTRHRAESLADGFQRQARALTAVLDAHEVPIGERLVDTTRLDIADENTVGCDLMPGDAVSNLAATTPAEFDARFSTLMERHLVGGVRMAATVLDRAELSAKHEAAVRGSQEPLG
ncbi:MAG: DUF305 domain-containing protein [Acidimicrobiia bacterium]